MHSFVNSQQSRLQPIKGRLPTNPFRISSPTALAYDNDKSQDSPLRIDGTAGSNDRQSPKPAPEQPNHSNAQQRAVKTPPSELVNIRYRGTWYDVTKWRRTHSAGPHWLDWFDKRDATEIIDGLHSTHSRQMTTRLPKAKPELAAQLEANTAPDSDVQLAFRELFDKLLAEGWWERDWFFEASQLSIWASLFFGAAFTAHDKPEVSFVLLAMSFVGGGWLGHDYIHGLDKFSKNMRLFLPVTTGLCGRWWSDKHNKHHALTNEIGVDEDMATDPILYTWAPDPVQDSPLRKFQHYFFWIPFTALFGVWRVDSLIAAAKNVELERPGAQEELNCILFHYAVIVAFFPIQVFLPAVLLAGLTSAFVVTSTHQSEEKFTEYIPDHVTRQFLCTRSVVMSNPISGWIWGGMQYQIEHHLFPSIPRSKLPALKPIIEKFAKDNNVDGGYRESGEFEILRMNWETYRAAALADPVEGAPLTNGTEGQQAAIAEGFTAVNPILPTRKKKTKEP